MATDWLRIYFDEIPIRKTVSMTVTPDAIRDYYSDKWPELAKGLSFGRVLIGAYQAETREDAQAVLRSALASAMSREERFDEWTLDAGALVAVRGGATRRNENLDKLAFLGGGALVGLFAPFGFILAYEYFGLIIYPIDLGAYLTAREGDDGIELADSVVFGISPYLRMRRLPLGVGVSLNYAPPIGDGSRHRVSAFLWAGLDLPLFTLK